MANELLDFYKNREIFITGGSGFIGEVIIEKLLRTFDVNRIYMLLREKKGVAIEKRLDEFKNHAVFDRIKIEKPNDLCKLTVIAGDISEIGLGLSPKSIELMQNVSIIIHSAATVRFDEPLQKAVLLNVRGTLEALKFAENLKQMVSFVHVSTLYCNPLLDHVEEKIYPSPVDWQACVKMSENMCEDTINALTEKYIQHFPNTYTFTKNLAEQVVKDFQHKVPVVIVRPSIVTATLIEPTPGYLASKSGTMGVLAIAGTGLLRTLIGKSETVIDQVGADVVSQICILCGWQRGINNLPNIDKEPYVSHCSGVEIFGLTMTEVVTYTSEVYRAVPLDKMIWKPWLQITNCFFYFFLRTLILQVLPSLLIDGILILKGSQPALMKIQRVIYSSVNQINFFLNKSYDFEIKNMNQIMDEATTRDGAEFYMYKIVASNREKAFKICAMGARRHTIKCKDEDLDKSKQLYIKLHYLDLFVRILIYYLLFKYISNYVISVISNYMQ